MKSCCVPMLAVTALFGLSCRASEMPEPSVSQLTNEVVALNGKPHKLVLKKTRAKSVTRLVIEAEDISPGAESGRPRMLVSQGILHLADEGIRCAVSPTGDRLCVLLRRNGPGVMATELYCWIKEVGADGIDRFAPYLKAKLPGKEEAIHTPITITTILGNSFADWESKNGKMAGGYAITEQQMTFSSDRTLALFGLAGGRYRFALRIKLTTPGVLQFEPFEMTDMEPPQSRSEDHPQ